MAEFGGSPIVVPRGPDFTITVTANVDPEQGMVAEGAKPGQVAAESDFPHVRNWVRGMILQIRGALPPGWDIEVVTLTETGGQREVGWGVLDVNGDGRG